ncbi:hypothetical protein [Streptomyces sp. BA2]|uniref:hypothetical protein n=1 Tax=Streptomyces sp. BA2 TaxID=436595 RepID=UPI0013299046|nr:hypothetical protein [Streptomyces sp. BA2]MWA07948.1 hypothetical protein [Streptomyces sp. BA2]
MSFKSDFKSACSNRTTRFENLVPLLKKTGKADSAWGIMKVSNDNYYDYRFLLDSPFRFEEACVRYDADRDPFKADIKAVRDQVPITIRHYTNGDMGPTRKPSFTQILSSWDLVNRIDYRGGGNTGVEDWCYFGNQKFVFSTLSIHDQPAYRIMPLECAWYTTIDEDSIEYCWCSADFLNHFDSTITTAKKAKEQIEMKWGEGLAGPVCPPLFRAKATSIVSAALSTVLRDTKESLGGDYVQKVISAGNDLADPGNPNSRGRKLAVQIQEYFQELEIKIPRVIPVDDWFENPLPLE